MVTTLIVRYPQNAPETNSMQFGPDYMHYDAGITYHHWGTASSLIESNDHEAVYYSCQWSMICLSRAADPTNAM